MSQPADQTTNLLNTNLVTDNPPVGNPPTINPSAPEMPFPSQPEPDLLMEVILTLLIPLLMTSGITDTGLARRAVQQAIATYTATVHDDLVCIAQIVGFALTALDNLRLSMPADLSLSMKLKLRANANALTRSSQKATATLHQQRQGNEPATRQHQPAAAPVQPPPQPPEAPAAKPPSAKPATGHHLSWASAMTDIAAECSAELPHLPPEQRQAQMTRINALTRTAEALHRGPTSLKSRLLSGTSLRS